MNEKDGNGVKRTRGIERRGGKELESGVHREREGWVLILSFSLVKTHLVYIHSLEAPTVSKGARVEAAETGEYQTYHWPTGCATRVLSMWGSEALV